MLTDSNLTLKWCLVLDPLVLECTQRKYKESVQS